MSWEIALIIFGTFISLTFSFFIISFSIFSFRFMQLSLIDNREFRKFLNKIKKGDYDFIVPLGYAMEGPKDNPRLPDPEKEILIKAFRIAKVSGGKLAWTSANYFYPEWQMREDALKLFCMDKYAKPGITAIIAPEGCRDSISEAETIKKMILKIDPNPKNILVLCDVFHSPRTSIIWKHAFPKTKITVVGPSIGSFSRDHPATLMKTGLRWFCVNYIMYVVMLLHLDFLTRKMHHPVQLKKA